MTVTREPPATDLELVPGFAPRRVREPLVDFGEDETRLPLSEAAATVDFSRQPMLRDYNIYPGMKNFPVRYWAASNWGHLYVESWTERDAALELDFELAVDHIGAQSLRLWCQLPGEDPTWHIPDLICNLRGGGCLVVDVKPPGLRNDKFKGVTEQTAAACASVGWEYRIMGDPDPMVIKNLWLLWHHNLDLHPAMERVADLLVDYVEERGQCTIGELSSEVDDPPLARPVIWHLLWWHELDCDLREQISDWTVVTLGSEA